MWRTGSRARTPKNPCSRSGHKCGVGGNDTVMPASRITMAGLVTLVAVGAGVVGAADIGAATALRRGSTACTQPSELLTQLLDGRISGCVRLGLLAAGPHTVVVQQILNSIPAA